MVAELLKKLVKARSTLDKGEIESANVLHEYFSSQNISSKIDSWNGNRANITAHIKGTGDRKALLFGSHIDVVPVGNEVWIHPPFEAVESDGKIFGRGSCDMKAGNAAIAIAAAEISGSGKKLKGDLIITATGGEETDSCGVVRFLSDCAKNMPDLVGIILPEPTNFDIITGHRGIYWLRVTTRGKTAHGSMPHLGINAITSMTAILERLKNYQPNCREHPNFGKSSMSINKIEGGKATNVIPDQCCIEIDIRTLPNQDTDAIQSDLRGIFEQLRSQIPDFKADIEVIRRAGSIFTDPDCEFVKAVKRSSGINETKLVGYTTDGPYFEKLGAPVIVFGPGKTELAHQPNEYVEIKDLHKAVELYKKIILEFLD